MNSVTISILIGIVVLIGVYNYFAYDLKKQKEAKLPENLTKWYENILFLIENTELSTIFAFVSNDGEKITFKEKTNSRNLFLLLHIDNIYITIVDDNGIEISRVETNNPGRTMGGDDEDNITMLYDLYKRAY
jgi:hypothetical protein